MTDYQIFTACFPELIIGEEDFNALAYGGDVCVFRTEGGFATVRGGCIELLCVAPEHQHKGHGTSLLKQCEEHISQNGGRAVLSGNMFPGAALSGADFFRKHGYSLGDVTYNEMSLELADFNVPQYEVPADAQFCFYSGSIGKLRSAVAEVDDDWVQYFNEDGMFYVCLVGEEIASFCIVDEDVRCLLSDGKRIGSVGCVGTVPKFREKGLGLHMVALASEHLKNVGCDRVFIHYTHIDRWYAKLGARTFLRFMTAERTL